MHVWQNGKHCNSKQTPHPGSTCLIVHLVLWEDSLPRCLPPPPLRLLQCVAGELLMSIQERGGGWNHYFKSVGLFVRVAQDRRAEDGKAQSVLIDLRGPLISLTASWFIEMGLRACQGYGSKHPERCPAPRVARNWGQLTVRWNPRSRNPLHQPLASH